MEEYSSKRTGVGLVTSTKSSSHVLRDIAKNRDQNAQFCNQFGYSSRLHNAKGTQVGCSERVKPFRTSSAGKEVIGSSSRTYSPVTNSRKTSGESRRKLHSQAKTDALELNSVRDEPEEQLHLHSGSAGFNGITQSEAGSSSFSSTTKSRTSLHQKPRMSNKDAVIPSPVSLPWKRVSQEVRGSARKYGLRNIGCNSVSDVINSGSSSSSSSSSSSVPRYNRRKDVAEKRIPDAESSSSTRGKKLNGLGNSSSSSGITISDSRRARSGLAIRDSGALSYGSRRRLTGFTRTRVGNQDAAISTLPDELNISMVPEISQPDTHTDLNAPSASRWFSIETSSSRPRSFSRPGSSRENLPNVVRASSPAGISDAHSSINRESFRQYNLDGIAEVLLAIERIEQDEELTYEQLLVLETNLFLNGLSFHDQHRDMRLDIDNMSYEELLALEERMGTVSTALSEEALSECLKSSIYRSTPVDGAIKNLGRDMDDTKCSICQEEYKNGDEVGRLHCEHRYHVSCVHQWLRLKNWCPICKASAAPS